MIPDPIGAAVVGPLAEAVGFQSALLLVALISAVPAVLVLLAPSVRSIGRGGPAPESEPMVNVIASPEAVA